MATRFTFTIRDWFWFSLVLCLAIGWGTHVRYSTLLENNISTDRYPTNEEYRKLASDSIDEAKRLRDEKNALWLGIRQIMTKEQQAELKKNFEKYKQAVYSEH